MAGSGVVLLSPHNDDETLFASFLILRHQPHVIVCLHSEVQKQYGITSAQREAETDAALATLGVPTQFEQWGIPDVDPDWWEVGRRVGVLAANFDRCIAPADEAGAPFQHREIGRMALARFGPKRVTSYTTYRAGGVRSTDGTLVPFEPEWLPIKHRALACYRSQMDTPSVVHFTEGLMEYTC